MSNLEVINVVVLETKLKSEFLVTVGDEGSIDRVLQVKADSYVETDRDYQFLKCVNEKSKSGGIRRMEIVAAIPRKAVKLIARVGCVEVPIRPLPAGSTK